MEPSLCPRQGSACPLCSWPYCLWLICTFPVHPTFEPQDPLLTLFRSHLRLFTTFSSTKSCFWFYRPFMLTFKYIPALACHLFDGVLVCLGPVSSWGICPGCPTAAILAGHKWHSKSLPDDWIDGWMNHSYLAYKFRMLLFIFPESLQDQALERKWDFKKIKVKKKFLAGISVCMQYLGSYSTAQEKQPHFLFCRNVKAKELWPWECLIAHIWSCFVP